MNCLKKWKECYSYQVWKSFLNDVEEVLNRLDSSVNSLKLAGKGEGCIDVAFLRTLGIDFLPKIMRGFLAANPTKKD